MLLVDEVDRADDEFEAFLLEVLADFTVTIPELGTVRAETPPLVVLTSNRTREVHDALKRRCLYHWLEHPDFAREVAILRRRLPERRPSGWPARWPGRRRLRDARPAQAARGRRDDGLGDARCTCSAPRGLDPERPRARSARAEVPRGHRPGAARPGAR